MQLHGKAALITGGTRGIGAATALAFAKEGADVAITSRHLDDDALHTQREIEALGRRCEIITADCAVPVIARGWSRRRLRNLGGWMCSSTPQAAR